MLKPSVSGHLMGRGEERTSCCDFDANSYLSRREHISLAVDVVRLFHLQSPIEADELSDVSCIETWA